MSKHTPGPWVFEMHQSSCTWYVQTPRGYADPTICEVATRANARLIAAAPELLEALEMIATFLDGQCDNGWEPQTVARHAIATATGEDAA